MDDGSNSTSQISTKSLIGEQMEDVASTFVSKVPYGLDLPPTH